MSHDLWMDAERVRRVEKMIRRKRRWAHLSRGLRLVAGIVLTIMMGLIVTWWMIMLLFSRRGSAIPLMWAMEHFWHIFAVIEAGILLGAWWIEESLFIRAAQENGVRASTMEIPTRNLLNRRTGDGDASVAVFIDVMVFPARLILSVVKETIFLMRLGRLNVPMATDLVARLQAQDQGLSLALLKWPTDSMDTLLMTVAHLRLMEIVDRSDERDRVWLLSRVRDELAKG